MYIIYPRLVVLYPPVVYTSPTNLTVNSSQQASIRCSYKSNPAKLTQVRKLNEKLRNLKKLIQDFYRTYRTISKNLKSRTR